MGPNRSVKRSEAPFALILLTEFLVSLDPA